MATTAAGGQLTQLHRRRQLALRAATLRELLVLWPMFNLDDIDGSWAPLEAALAALIALRRRDSSGLAANYYRAFREAEIGGQAIPQIADPPDPLLVTAALRLMGPIGAKKNIAVGRKDVAATTLTRIAGVVSKKVMDGGRETLTATIQSDSKAKGWRRITSGRSCGWCARVAAEGVVAKDASFGSHDHCSCTAEVVF